MSRMDVMRCDGIRWAEANGREERNATERAAFSTVQTVLYCMCTLCVCLRVAPAAARRNDSGSGDGYTVCRTRARSGAERSRAKRY